jgi:hypothetical protein
LRSQESAPLPARGVHAIEWALRRLPSGFQRTVLEPIVATMTQVHGGPTDPAARLHAVIEAFHTAVVRERCGATLGLIITAEAAESDLAGPMRLVDHLGELLGACEGADGPPAFVIRGAAATLSGRAKRKPWPESQSSSLRRELVLLLDARLAGAEAQPARVRARAHLRANRRRPCLSPRTRPAKADAPTR